MSIKISRHYSEICPGWYDSNFDSINYSIARHISINSIGIAAGKLTAYKITVEYDE